MQILKAQRKRLKARIGISGPSGSGKTYSALLLAYGMTGNWEKICVIDTEVGSSNNYSHLGDFNVLELSEPFSPERFIEAIKACENAGMEAIIIDSASHEWEGKGGCLELTDTIAKAKFKGNTWGAWSEVTPRHQRFIEAITQSKAHIITTSRSKTETAVVDGKPKKVGLKDIQREGFEYELTLMFNVDRETHLAVASKDRTSLFIDRDPFLLSTEIGQEFGRWLDSGVDPEQIEAEKKAKEEQRRNEMYEVYLARLSEVASIEGLQAVWEDIKTDAKSLGRHLLDDLTDRVKSIKMEIELGRTTPKSEAVPEAAPEPAKATPQTTQTQAVPSAETATPPPAPKPIETAPQSPTPETPAAAPIKKPEPVPPQSNTAETEKPQPIPKPTPAPKPQAIPQAGTSAPQKNPKTTQMETPPTQAPIAPNPTATPAETPLPPGVTKIPDDAPRAQSEFVAESARAESPMYLTYKTQIAAADDESALHDIRKKIETHGYVLSHRERSALYTAIDDKLKNGDIIRLEDIPF